MNKIWRGLAALSLLALPATSCTEESVETNHDDDREINYKAAVGRPAATRAGETNPSNITNKTLKVWVYYNEGTGTDDTRFDTYLLTNNGGLWSYGSAVFHPEAGLTHYSIHPSDGVVTASTGELNAVDASASNAGFDYTANRDEDLIAAIARTTGDSPANATADLVYKHLLSQINFAVSGLEGITITVSDIKLGGIASQGSYKFVGGWGGLSTPVGYTYTIEGSGTTTGAADEVIYFGNHTGGVADYSKTNALMLLPQSFAPSGSAFFSFDYVMKDANNTGIVLKSGNDVTVALDALTPAIWESGKRYLYTINFADLNIIKYTVDISGWTDYGTGGVVTPPAN